MSKRQLPWVMAGCVQGTVCAGRSGDKTHVSARCWGSETGGGAGEGGARWKGRGCGLAWGKQLPLCSHLGPARSSQILMKSCQEWRRGPYPCAFQGEEPRVGTSGSQDGQSHWF